MGIDKLLWVFLLASGLSLYVLCWITAITYGWSAVAVLAMGIGIVWLVIQAAETW